MLRSNLKTNSLIGLIELKNTPLITVMEPDVLPVFLNGTVGVKIGVTASKPLLPSMR
jgi:hypothetical protein